MPRHLTKQNPGHLDNLSQLSKNLTKSALKKGSISEIYQLVAALA